MPNHIAGHLRFGAQARVAWLIPWEGLPRMEHLRRSPRAGKAVGLAEVSPLLDVFQIGSVHVR